MTFWKLDLFPSLGEGRDTPALLDPLEKAKVSLPSSQDVRRFSFRNAVFSRYLEIRTKDKAHNPIDSEY
jgi:hypothetical protein